MEGAVGPPPPRRQRRRTTTTTITTGNTISDLPDHTICDILLRLPLKSIFGCKRVCKNWRKLLLEPYFTKLHLSRSPPLSLIRYSHPYSTDPAHFGVLELDDPTGLRRRNTTMKFRTEIHIPHGLIQIVGSWNGLICFSDRLDTVIVCNPIREQYLILPKPPKPAAQSYCSGYGLGYNPSTDQHKVLRFTGTYTLPSGSDGEIHTEIYTLGNDDGWRSIGGTGRPFPLHLEHFVYLNGALHWIGFPYAILISRKSNLETFQRLLTLKTLFLSFWELWIAFCTYAIILRPLLSTYG